MALTKINNNTLSAITGLPTGVGGKVLQVVSTVKKTETSTSSNTAVNITGMSVAITPSSSSNKILITANLYIGQTSGFNRVLCTITGGNAASYIGDANGALRRVSSSTSNRVNDGYGMLNQTMSFYDAPATTSEITYQLQWQTNGGTAVYINRPATIDGNSGSTACTITVMEISA